MFTEDHLTPLDSMRLPMDNATAFLKLMVEGISVCSIEHNRSSPRGEGPSFRLAPNHQRTVKPCCKVGEKDMLNGARVGSGIDPLGSPIALNRMRSSACWVKRLRHWYRRVLSATGRRCAPCRAMARGWHLGGCSVEYSSALQSRAGNSGW